MKDKSTKQPWPRSARVTVWVLGILLSIASVNVWLLCEKVQEYKNAPRVDFILPDFEEIERAGEEICLPFEEPPKEIKPKAKEAAEVSAPQISEIQKLVTRFWVPPLYGMSPELKKKIFVDGEGKSTMIVETFRRRKLPNGEWIDILPNGKMVYNGSPLTENGADLLEAWMRARVPRLYPPLFPALR